MNLLKKLSVPDGFAPPLKLSYEDIIATPLTRADLKEDLVAVNSSLDIIRKTRGGSWPKEELSEEFDLLDLAWHEREFRDKTSFAYVIHLTSGEYVGCFYLYPIGERTEFNDKTKDYDVDASWWVTQTMYDAGYYKKSQTALNEWLKNDFPFVSVYYSNRETAVS